MALRTSEGASSSSSTSPPIYEHDVFVSFSGEDTRNTFTSHLYQAMSDKGIQAFKDDAELERGEEISPGLLRAIESARCSVVVFSEKYATSTWCLNELVKITECRKEGQKVLPIFYKVDPSEVRKQTGPFGLALAEHERKFNNNMDKVRKWREALTEVANLSGFTFKDGESESELIQTITKEILKVKLKRMHLFVPTYQVGIDSHAKNVELILDPRRNNVQMVGIYGVGGVGKTTIAKAVYNNIVDHFDEGIFLEDVCEMSKTNEGIIQLQNKLLSKSLRDSCSNVNSVPEGITMIKDKLCRKKLLLVLDDVDDRKEIENLLGDCDWFAGGSRIIITTRDKQVLNTLENPYEVKELDQLEALELFSWHAFRRSEPEADYLQLSKQIICYANGLPLALGVLGSYLRGRNTFEWQCELQQYEVIPTKGIQEVLKKSFKRLEQIEQEIFLDIACFFKGWDKDYVVNMLEACGLYPKSVIPKLIEKCLITVDQFGKLSMHDLIQQMGREIVREESPEYPGQRSRLWYYKDALDVLNENTGTDKIRGLRLCWPEPEPRMMHLEAKTFKKMKNLKFLIVHNVHILRGLQYLPNGLRLLDWPGYSHPLPSTFCPQSLVELNMPYSRITLEEPFWQGIQLENLKYIKCGSCESIMQVPALHSPNLEVLDLSKCKNLIVVDESVGSLDKLEIWILEGCEKLQTLPRSLMLRSLRYFDLRDCLMLEKFPNILPGMESLQTLLLLRTGINGLPSSIGYLTRLEKLDLSYCQSLMDLPDSIYKLQHLRNLEISHCTKLKIDRRLTYHSFGSEYGFLKLEYLSLNNCENLTELDLLMMPDYFPELKYLYLDGTNICMIPESISRFARLRRLGIKNCKQLQKIRRLPQSIRAVCAMNCKSLNSQSLSCMLSQAQEILGISPDKICQGARSDISVDPQSSNQLSHQFVLSSQLIDEFASEAKCSISEDEDIDCEFILPIIDIPKCFNHQSVGNSISFWVGPRFPKFAFYIAFGPEAQRGGFDCQVYLKINGCKKSINFFSHEEEICDHLWLFSKSHQKLQKQLNDSNPSKQNLVELVCNLYFPDGGESLPTFIKGCGVHVKCTCQLSSSNL